MSTELPPDRISQGEREEEATSGCRDLQLSPDAWHPWDFPPATALRGSSWPWGVTCTLLLGARGTLADFICILSLGC